MRGKQLPVLIIGLAFVLTSCRYEAASETPRALSPEDAFMRYGLRFSSFKIEKGNTCFECSGPVYNIVGSVKNTSSKGYTSAQIWVHVYDADGTRISERMVTAQSLWPDETVKVSEPLGINMQSGLKKLTVKVKSVVVQP